MREPAATLAAELLARALERGSFDLLRDFAQPYSIALICRLLGVPLDRQRDLLDWSHAMREDVRVRHERCAGGRGDRAAEAFRGYVLELIAERRRSPRDDMIGGARRGSRRRRPAERRRDRVDRVVLLNAGHEATVNTLGNGIRALPTIPGEWQPARRRGSRAAAAIEELIRWDPPLQLFERWVLDDGVEVAGVPDAARRDGLVALRRGESRPSGVPRARIDSTWPARTPPRTSASAAASTSCIGAPLARIELEAALQALVDAPPASSSSPSRERLPAFVIRGFESVPVRLR